MDQLSSPGAGGDVENEVDSCEGEPSLGWQNQGDQTRLGLGTDLEEQCEDEGHDAMECTEDGPLPWKHVRDRPAALAFAREHGIAIGGRRP